MSLVKRVPPSPLDPSPVTPKGLCPCSYPICFLYHQILLGVGSFHSASRPTWASPILAPWPSDLSTPSQRSSSHPPRTPVYIRCLWLLTECFLSGPSQSCPLPARLDPAVFRCPGHPPCPPQALHGSLCHLLLGGAHCQLHHAGHSLLSWLL